MAGIDTASQVTLIADQLTSVALIGGAVLLVVVAYKAWHWMRDAMDAEDGFSELGHVDEFDLPENYREDYGNYFAECPECGCNSVDDPEFIQASKSDRCGQCGADLDMSEVG